MSFVSGVFTSSPPNNLHAPCFLLEYRLHRVIFGYKCAFCNNHNDKLIRNGLFPNYLVSLSLFIGTVVFGQIDISKLKREYFRHRKIDNLETSFIFKMSKL